MHPPPRPLKRIKQWTFKAVIFFFFKLFWKILTSYWLSIKTYRPPRLASLIVSHGSTSKDFSRLCLWKCEIYLYIKVFNLFLIIKTNFKKENRKWTFLLLMRRWSQECQVKSANNTNIGTVFSISFFFPFKQRHQKTLTICVSSSVMTARARDCVVWTFFDTANTYMKLEPIIKVNVILSFHHWY